MILATCAELYSVAELTSELERLARLAAVVLNEHCNDNGVCAVCRRCFPCESAVLAEHNVALL